MSSPALSPPPAVAGSNKFAKKKSLPTQDKIEPLFQASENVFGKSDNLPSGFPSFAQGALLENIWPQGVHTQLLERVLALTCFLNSWDILNQNLAQEISEKICEVLHAERANVYLFTGDKKVLSLLNSEESSRITFNVGTGIAGAVGQTLEILNLVEAYNHPAFNLTCDQYPPSAPPCVTMLVVPIRSGNGEPIGVLQIVNKRTSPQFSRQDELIAALFAVQVAVVLKLWAQKEEQRFGTRQNLPEEEAKVLLEYADQLFCCPSTDRLVLLAGYQAPRIVPSGHGTLFLVEPDGENLWTLRGTSHEMKKLSFRMTKDTTAGWVAIHPEPLSVPNVYEDGRFNANIDTRTVIGECNILCVPVCQKTDGKLLGVLEVVKKAKSMDFTDDDIKLLSAYAQQVALALVQTQTLDENLLLSRQCRSLSSHMDFIQALPACRAALCAILRAAAARIYLLHPNGKVLCLNQQLAGDSPDNAEDAASWVPIGEGIVGMVGKTMQMMNIPNAYTEPLFDPQIDIETNFKTSNLLAFPLLRRNGHLLGVVVVLNKEIDGGFTIPDEERARTLSDQISRLIENCEKYTLAQRTQRQGTVLAKAACELFNTYDAVQLSKLCAKQVRELLSTDHCAIYLRDFRTDELWARVEGVRKEMRFARGQGLVGHVAVSKSAEYIKDAIQDPRLAKNSEVLLGLNSRTMFIAPLMGMGDEVVGVVQLLDRKPDAYTEEDRVLLAEYFHIVGAAIENCNLFAKKLVQIQTGVPTELGRQTAHGMLSRNVAQLVGAEAVFIYVLDRTSLVYYGGGSPKVFPMHAGMAGFVATSGSLVKSDNVLLEASFNPTVDMLDGIQTRSALVVPLRDSQGHVVGVISVQNKRKGIFSREDVATLQGLSFQHGEIICGCEAIEILNRRNTSMHVLLVEAHNLLRLSTMRDLLYQAGKLAERVLLVEHCSVFAYQSDSGEMIAVHVEENEIKELRFPVTDETVAGCVCKTKMVINLPNVYEDERFDNVAGDSSQGPCSMLCVPIFGSKGTEIIGVIELINSVFGAFTEFRHEEEELTQLFAGLVSTALNNFYLLQRTMRLIRMTTYFQQMSTSLDPIEVRSSISNAFQDALDCEHVFVFIADGTARALRFASADDPTSILTVSYGHGTIGSVTETKSILRVVDAHKDPMFDRRLDNFVNVKTRTMLVVPVVDNRSELQGVVCAINKKEGQFSGDDESFVKVLAVQAGVMIKNSSEADTNKKAHEKRVVFAELLREVLSQPTLEKMFLAVENYGRELLDVRKSRLFLTNEAENGQKRIWTIRTDDFNNIEPMLLDSISTSILGQAALASQLMVEEVSEEKLRSIAESASSSDRPAASSAAAQYRANLLCVPLPNHLGVIEAAGKRGAQFSDEDKFQLSLIADVFGEIIRLLSLWHVEDSIPRSIEDLRKKSVTQSQTVAQTVAQ